MANVSARLVCDPLAEHSPGQQRESERSARKSSCSQQARTQTPGCAGGDWQQSPDTTGFEEDGNRILSLLGKGFKWSLCLTHVVQLLKTGGEGCTQGGGCG